MIFGVNCKKKIMFGAKFWHFIVKLIVNVEKIRYDKETPAIVTL